MSYAAPFGDAGGLYGGYYGGLIGVAGGHGVGGHGFSQQLGASPASALMAGGTEEAQLDAAAAAGVAAEETARRKGGGAARDEKAAMALKSHSEAERRRRERINAHLATLRGMVPCTDKMDKAALLAEVIDHVKKLKSDAARIARHCPVPSGADEVTVEAQEASAATGDGSVGGGGGGGRFVVKATLSCDDCADLFADARRALQPLGLKVVGSEVTTLGGRVRLAFLVSCADAGGAAAAAESLRRTLDSVLDKVTSSAFDVFAPRESLLAASKRRRVSSSTFESSSSSS